MWGFKKQFNLVGLLCLLWLGAVFVKSVIWWNSHWLHWNPKVCYIYIKNDLCKFIVIKHEFCTKFQHSPSTSSTSRASLTQQWCNVCCVRHSAHISAHKHTKTLQKTCVWHEAKEWSCRVHDRGLNLVVLKHHPFCLQHEGRQWKVWMIQQSLVDSSWRELLLWYFLCLLHLTFTGSHWDPV